MIEKIDKEEIINIRDLTNITVDKINEIIEHLNNQKQSFSSLYGIPMKDFIKKEDLKKYLEVIKDEADRENLGYAQIDLTNLILINNGMKNCCDYIIKKFSL